MTIKLFPIGSVVKLKDLNQPVMIIGRMIISANKRDFDYVGVPYPVGYLGDEKCWDLIMAKLKRKCIEDI